MATNRVTPIQLLRSILLNKRPDPAKLLPGQPAVNTNAAQPGLFFADETNSKLIKIGPCAVGATAPNAGSTGAPGQLGNTLGELWLDTTSTLASPGPKLRVWDGTQWTNVTPFAYAAPVVTDVEPTLGLYPDGTMWWSSSAGLLYILYNDGTSRQWVQISSATVS